MAIHGIPQLFATTNLPDNKSDQFSPREVQYTLYAQCPESGY